MYGLICKQIKNITIIRAKRKIKVIVIKHQKIKIKNRKDYQSTQEEKFYLQNGLAVKFYLQ